MTRFVHQPKVIVLKRGNCATDAEACVFDRCQSLQPVQDEARILNQVCVLARYLSTGRMCPAVTAPIMLPRAEALEDWTLESLQMSILPNNPMRMPPPYSPA